MVYLQVLRQNVYAQPVPDYLQKVVLNTQGDEGTAFMTLSNFTRDMWAKQHAWSQDFSVEHEGRHYPVWGAVFLVRPSKNDEQKQVPLYVTFPTIPGGEDTSSFVRSLFNWRDRAHDVLDHSTRGLMVSMKKQVVASEASK